MKLQSWTSSHNLGSSPDDLSIIHFISFLYDTQVAGQFLHCSGPVTGPLAMLNQQENHVNLNGKVLKWN